MSGFNFILLENEARLFVFIYAPIWVAIFFANGNYIDSKLTHCYISQNNRPLEKTISTCATVTELSNT